MDPSIWSERTVLPNLSSSVESSQSGSEIMDIWRLLSEKSQSLRVFTAASFVPSETQFKVGEGSTYRVDIAKIHGAKTPTLVAVKNVISSNAPRTTVLQELRIQTHAPLQKCPNIVGLMGYGWDIESDRASLYLVVEYSPFGTLNEFLSARKGTVTCQEKLGYCQDVASGLEALHSCSIAQGDVKMENTLVFGKPETTGYIVKLSDFGHALTDDNSRYLGTELLNAPEIRKRGLVGLRSLDEHFKSDIFSYGLLVWEIVQDGERYQIFGGMEDPVGWLNNLPKDGLLQLALLALRRATMTAAVRHELQNILNVTIRDDPEDRAIIQDIVEFYSSARAKVYETPEQ